MSSFSNYLENKLIDHVFNNVAYTSPTTVYLAAYTVAPDDTGGGTEVTGAGYARQAVSFESASGGANANDAAVEYTADGGNYGDVVAIGYFDAATGGNLLAWDDFTGATIDDTDTLRFAIGALTNTLT